MSYLSSVKNWEGLAKKDPLWAILTDEGKKGNQWKIDEFFRSGEEEINTLFNLLGKNNWLPPVTDHALDFGCGVGRTSRSLAGRFNKVTGIDASETMIQKAGELKTTYPGNVEFIVNTGKDLSLLPDEEFSFIFSTIVLQHIPYPHSLKFIAEFTRKIRKGGIMVFQVPTRDIRKITCLQKLKEKLKTRERLASIGIGSGYRMSMNPVDKAIIIDTLQKSSCEILAILNTNHTDPKFNGKLLFIEESACADYISSLFIVRKI